MEILNTLYNLMSLVFVLGTIAFAGAVVLLLLLRLFSRGGDPDAKGSKCFFKSA